MNGLKQNNYFISSLQYIYQLTYFHECFPLEIDFLKYLLKLDIMNVNENDNIIVYGLENKENIIIKKVKKCQHLRILIQMIELQ